MYYSENAPVTATQHYNENLCLYLYVTLSEYQLNMDHTRITSQPMMGLRTGEDGQERVEHIPMSLNSLAPHIDLKAEFEVGLLHVSRPGFGSGDNTRHLDTASLERTRSMTERLAQSLQHNTRNSWLNVQHQHSRSLSAGKAGTRDAARLFSRIQTKVNAYPSDRNPQEPQEERRTLKTKEALQRALAILSRM
jgi:hypothetical protein